MCVYLCGLECSRVTGEKAVTEIHLKLTIMTRCFECKPHFEHFCLLFCLVDALVCERESVCGMLRGQDTTSELFVGRSDTFRNSVPSYLSHVGWVRPFLSLPETDNLTFTPNWPVMQRCQD